MPKGNPTTIRLSPKDYERIRVIKESTGKKTHSSVIKLSLKLTANLFKVNDENNKKVIEK